MSHELHDAISLEIGRRVANRLQATPALIDVARSNLARWSRLNADAPSLLRCYDEWQEILAWPLNDVCELLRAQTDEAQRLRQNSPFAGVLPPAEVWSIKSEIRRRHAQNAA
ncbi:MAG: hypothetical protein SGI90_00540 [Candidatus Eisenbacteria bacterium]|nr:hypothetical protein [Candidatus Eisenbacteria bacterium]